MKHKVVLGVFTFNGEFPGKKSDLMISMWRTKGTDHAATVWAEYNIINEIITETMTVDDVREFLSEYVVVADYTLKMGMVMHTLNAKERFHASLDMMVDNVSFEFDVRLVTQYESDGEKKYIFAVIVKDKNIGISFRDPITEEKAEFIGKKSMAFIEEVYDGKPLPDTNSRLLYNFAVDLFKS